MSSKANDDYRVKSRPRVWDNSNNGGKGGQANQTGNDNSQTKPTDDLSHEFRKGSKLDSVFTLLSDNKWHCSRHEMSSSQPAGLIRVFRDLGYSIQTRRRVYCTTCNSRETQRRMTSNLPNLAQKKKKSLATASESVVQVMVAGTKAELETKLGSKRGELAELNTWRRQLLVEIKQLTYSLLQLDASNTTTTASIVVSDVDKAS